MEGIYKIDIDFDESIKEWNKNKKKIDQYYVYICGLTTNKVNCCQNKRYKENKYCYIHRKYE